MNYILHSKIKKNVNLNFDVLLARAREITFAVAKAKKFESSPYTRDCAERNTYHWMKANQAIVPCQASTNNEQQGKKKLR